MGVCSSWASPLLALQLAACLMLLLPGPSLGFRPSAPKCSASFGKIFLQILKRKFF
jgi:hypothetical protein